MSLGIPQKKLGRMSLLVLRSVPLIGGASRTSVAALRNFGRNAVVPRIYDLLTPVILPTAFSATSRRLGRPRCSVVSQEVV